MTRLLHDQFAKQYLEELLSPLGEVKTSQNIAAEVRQVDVLFVPKQQNAIATQALGLLGKMAATPAIFEPFRNPATADDILNCMGKLIAVERDRLRQAKRDNDLANSSPYQLWILTPTASSDLLDQFGAKLKTDPGIHYLAEALRTAIVVIHQLPRTPQTLWLRMLGRGNVQKGAIAEFRALPNATPFKDGILEVLSNFFAILEARQNLTTDDRELIMELSPVYLERIQTAADRGQRIMVESMLQVKFGEIDEKLTQIVDRLLQLPPLDRTQLIMELSREELLSRFSTSD